MALHDEVFQLRSANREDKARLYVRASNFWCKGQEAFFDIRVFYLIAPFCRQKDLISLYQMHKLEKKQEYAKRVREVERGAITPLVFASTGGMDRECTICFKRIADILSDRKKMSFSQVLYLIRCRISFALLRLAIRAIRGSRQLRRPAGDCTLTVYTQKAIWDPEHVILHKFSRSNILLSFSVHSYTIFIIHSVYGLFSVFLCITSTLYCLVQLS